jgi:hypothetical protein
MSLPAFEQWLRAKLPEAADSLNPGAGERSLDDQVLREWQRSAQLAEGLPESQRASGAVKMGDANRHWIPFADDAGGNFLAIDMDPGPRGFKGQVINFGRDEVNQYALAPDVSSFIAWIAGELARGNHRIEDEDDHGRSFNIGEPESSHFLDATRILFGGEAAKKTPPRSNDPPRDSVPGVLHFMRTELAQQVPSSWNRMRVVATVRKGLLKARAPFTAEYETKDGGGPQALAPRNPALIEDAILEFQSRAKEERWNWSKVTIEFDVDDTGFQVDAE